MRLAFRLLMCLMLGTLAACGSSKSPPPPYPGIKIGKPYQIYGRWYKPAYDAHYDEIGTASWYGPGFHGGHTSSGERFDQDALTAAHDTLPLPSIVRVTNLDNGQSALIKINDRGPFSHDRIIDLSKGSAKKLGVWRTGTARVRVQFLDKETREYVQNMQNGTAYAMNEVGNVNSDEAGAREEAAARPQLQMGSAMFAETAPAAGASETITVDQAPGAQPVEVDTPNAEIVVRPSGTTILPPKSAATPATGPDIFSVVSDAEAAPPPPAQSLGPTESPGIVPLANHGAFLQAGTFSNRENAERRKRSLSALGHAEVLEVKNGERTFYRVLMGPYNTDAETKNLLSKLSAAGISDVEILRN